MICFCPYILNGSLQLSNFEDEIPLRGEECNNATFQTPSQELRMILWNIYYIDFTELSVKQSDLRYINLRRVIILALIMIFRHCHLIVKI